MDETTELAALLDVIGWENAELGARLGISPGTVKQWRNGHRRPVDTVVPWLRLVAAGIQGAPPCPNGWVGLKRGRRPSPDAAQ